MINQVLSSLNIFDLHVNSRGSSLCMIVFWGVGGIIRGRGKKVLGIYVNRGIMKVWRVLQGVGSLKVSWL